MINKRNVNEFCSEDISLIENYDKAINDNTQTWHIHHRLEIQDDKVMSRDELKKAGLYYHRPASELIFLTPSEHRSTHHKGKQISEESKCKLSESHKGKKHSKETKQKIGKAHKGKQFSEEYRQKLREAWVKRKTKKVSINTIYKIKNNNNETISNNI